MINSTGLTLLAAITLSAGLIACGGDDLVLPSEGAPASIVLVQGDGQSGRVGETLPQPLLLEVSDVTGRPVAGATVVVELDGADARPDTVRTEDDGRASVGVVLGPEVGPAPGAARVVMPDSEESVEVQFTVNAVAASANGLSLESGDDQSARAGEALAQPLVVRVTDAFGNPIAGVPIAWTAVGGGSVSEQSTASDESGRASVIRTLGPTSGEQLTEAASADLAGSPVVFSHTAAPGNAAGVTIVAGNGQSGAPGSQLAQALLVRVTDAAGNPINGAAVTWVVTGGGGTLDPATSTTDATGHASSNWTLGSSPGANSAEAVVSGVGQASFTATALVGGPDEVRIVSGNRQAGQVGQRLGSDLVVLVLDESDNPIAGATVAWQVREGGGTVEPAIGTTDAAGQASAGWTLGSSPGANRLEASVSGAGSVTFEATASAGAPSVLAISTQPSSSAQVGVSLPRQPVIQLRDASGNSVGQAGVAVTAAIASGPGSLAGAATVVTDGNGRATFTDLGISAEGAHTLIFAASGFTSVTSAAVAVGRAATTTSITSDSPDPSAPGEPVTVAFTVSSDVTVAAGIVTVTAAGGSESCSADVTAGNCVIVLSAPGDRQLTASYGGNPQFAPSSDTESHEVRTVNAPPSFTAGPDQSVSVSAGAQTIPAWATNISAGPNETGQAVQFLVQVVTGAEFFAVAPQVSPDGTLTYTPGGSGSAQVEVRLRDNGGGANDTSAPATVTFTLSP